MNMASSLSIPYLAVMASMMVVDSSASATCAAAALRCSSRNRDMKSSTRRRSTGSVTSILNVRLAIGLAPHGVLVLELVVRPPELDPLLVGQALGEAGWRGRVDVGRQGRGVPAPDDLLHPLPPPP